MISMKWWLRYYLNNFIILIIWRIFINEKENDFENDEIKEKLIFEYIYLSRDLIFSLNLYLSDWEKKKRFIFKWITREIYWSMREKEFIFQWILREIYLSKKKERFILKWISREKKERFILK